MKFVRWEDLKEGMRLARPIYSKNGVLLYDRDSQISKASIDSIRNFGLLGIYILEPAEPLPPMSDEDREFERFQTVMVASISDEIKRIISTRRTKSILTISGQILKNYGHHEGRINFYQNLRSKDDFVFRHSLNVAILCALISNQLNISLEDRQNLIYAALVHDIGRINSKNEAIYGGVEDDNKRNAMYMETLTGYDCVEDAFASEGTAIKRICNQAIHAQMDMENGKDANTKKMVIGAKILLVANRFDEKTAMTLSGESISEVRAIKEFIDNPDIYDSEVVAALIASVNILFPGVSVELSTGEKALVIADNIFNVLQPTVLCFKDNSILDLSLGSNSDIYVMDVMKTLDNRYIMDTDTLGKFGGNTNA